MNEWALLVFTLCIPTAIGGFLFLALAHRTITKSTKDPLSVMKIPLLSLVGIAIVGLMGSFFHLGSPMNAINTLLGFGKSWMSNEIVLTSAFIGLAVITAGLALVQKRVNKVLLIVTGIVGLIDVYAMAKLYMVTQVVGWDHINTFFVFYGTVFTLGPVIAASLLSIKLKGEDLSKLIKWAFAIAIFGITIQIIGATSLVAAVPGFKMIGGSTLTEVLAPYSSMIMLRWVLEGAGLIILGMLALASTKKINYSFVYVALLIFIIAEGLSRYLFYVIGA